jgi:hypothetical protein
LDKSIHLPPPSLSVILNTLNNTIIGNNGIIIHNIITLNKLNIKIKNIIKEKKIIVAADNPKDKNKSHHSSTHVVSDHVVSNVSNSLKSKTANHINNSGPETES